MLTPRVRAAEDTACLPAFQAIRKETSSVASTLLAVDDSVTMRKVLEITFAGPDFRVVTADSPDAALQKLKADKPALVIADVSLEPKNGYELCRAIKQASPSTPVLILSSKQNPFDAAKGSSAQADDHMDKPFDTQQMIDKVKKLLQSAGARPAVQPVAEVPKATAPTAPSMQSPIAASPARPVAPVTTAVAPAGAPLPPGAAAAAAAAGGAQLTRAKTLIYNAPGGGVPGAAPPVRAPAPPIAPTPVAGLPQQPRTPAVEAPSPAPPAVTIASAHVNGQLAGKLEQIGLTPAQVDAVLALSREVVERVVWEVVPVLAETIIKEEISRLTK
jgi:CheY-like chemotaxis protein